VSDNPPIDRGRLFHNVLTGIRLCWAAAPLSFLAILAMVALDSAIPPVVLLLSRQLVNRVVSGTGLTTALLAVVIGLGLASGLERAMSAVRNHWQDIFSQRVQQAATVRFLRQAGTIDLGHLDQPEFQDHMERANNGWRSGDLTQTGIGLAGNLFSLAGMLGILLSIHPLLVVLGLLSVVPTFAMQRRANRRIFDFWYSWTPLERERDYLRWLLSRPHGAKEMRAFAWVELQRGVLDLAHGRHAEAETHYARAARAYSGWWLVDEHRAELLAAQGDLAGAAALYETVVAAVPRPELHQALGQLYALMERPGRARSQFVQARAGYLAPVRRGGVHSLHHLADFYAEAMIDGAKALEWARRDLALRETFSTQAALAWALLRDGQAAEAAAWMDRALASGVKDAHLCAQAAAVFEAAGDGAKAATMRDLARSINPRLGPFHVHR